MLFLSFYHFSVALQMFYTKKIQDEMGNEKETTEIMNLSKEYKTTDIFNRLMEVSKKRKFKESVEVIVKLNVDPTRGD